MKIKKVSVIGLGALGILFGHQLAKKIGSDFSVIADQKRIAKYRAQGIFCNGEAYEFHYQAPTDNDLADLIIFAVKINGLEEAIESVRNHVGPDTIMMSLLNGITSETIIGDAFGEANLIWSVTQGMDTVKEDNLLFYTNPGIICFGNRNGGESSEKINRIQGFFDRTGIAYQIDNQMDRKIWAKFMLNVGVNQVVSIFGENFGSVQKPGKLRELMIAAMAEVILVAGKEGVVLTRDDITYWLGVVDSLSPQGKPSMRQDVEARRLSEVELFSGTVNRLGAKHGIDTPVNGYLYEEIKAIESQY
ncbi:MAG: 2-dehydropantoate 2-reductase [Acetobacterium sp.]|nr:2-dehydropantoate 2-reductase [Bacillota bacterium]MCG2731044.1 2-dehydropantoate 2-reductase [Acetobacterium sp.]